MSMRGPAQGWETGEDGIQLEEVRYKIEDGEASVIYGREKVDATAIHAWTGANDGYVVFVYMCTAA